jgi:hypothetical protein
LTSLVFENAFQLLANDLCGNPQVRWNVDIQPVDMWKVPNDILSSFNLCSRHNSRHKSRHYSRHFTIGVNIRGIRVFIDCKGEGEGGDKSMMKREEYLLFKKRSEKNTYSSTL